MHKNALFCIKTCRYRHFFCAFAAQDCLSMKKFLIALFAITTVISAFASEAKIDKESCTITKDGKTYKLYGKVKIVDSFEDIKIKIVEHFEGVK